MASSSSKKLQVILFVVAALLFLVCTRGQAARPVPGSSEHMPQPAVVSTAVHEKSGSGPGMEVNQEEPEAIKGCEGELEKCLMRRTLVAHTDYIYTQGKHN